MTMTNATIKLKASTQTSRIAATQAAEHVTFTRRAKKHVPGMGYVIYLMNETNECVGHIVKEYNGVFVRVK